MWYDYLEKSARIVLHNKFKVELNSVLESLEILEYTILDRAQKYRDINQFA